MPAGKHLSVERAFHTSDATIPAASTLASVATHHLQRQIDDLRRRHPDYYELYQDVVSGLNWHRPGLQVLLERLQQGKDLRGSVAGSTASYRARRCFDVRGASLWSATETCTRQGIFLLKFICQGCPLLLLGTGRNLRVETFFAMRSAVELKHLVVGIFRFRVSRICRSVLKMGPFGSFVAF